MKPQDNLENRIPQLPRSVMGEPLWPFAITATMTADEIEFERNVHLFEIELTRPRSKPWMRALAGALAALSDERSGR